MKKYKVIFSNIISWQGNGDIQFGEEKIVLKTNRINKALRVANKVYNDNINYRGHETLNGKTVTVEVNGEMLCSFGYRGVITSLNKEEKNFVESIKRENRTKEQLAQKQEKLLELYKELTTVKDELISIAWFDAPREEMEEKEAYLDKQIKELEK